MDVLNRFVIVTIEAGSCGEREWAAVWLTLQKSTVCFLKSGDKASSSLHVMLTSESRSYSKQCCKALGLSDFDVY